MAHLSREIETLARRLAAAQGTSMEEAIKQALEQSARKVGIAFEPVKSRDCSPRAIATRKSRIDQVADEIARMPVLDPRSSRDIMDDLNAL